MMNTCRCWLYVQTRINTMEKTKNEKRKTNEKKTKFNKEKKKKVEMLIPDLICGLGPQESYLALYHGVETLLNAYTRLLISIQVA